MKIVVAIKQVPARDSELNLDRTLSPGTYLMTLEAGTRRESLKLVVPCR